jgi:hypothetical protein
MKRSVTGLVALLAGAFVAHCQGTVSLANYLVLSNYIYVHVAPGNIAPGGEGGTAPVWPSWEAYIPNGPMWTVAVYGAAGWNVPASSLVQLETANGQPLSATLADGNTDTIAGTWYSTTIGEIPDTSLIDGRATVQLYAWYNGGDNYAYSEAVRYSLPAGCSATANIMTGGPYVGALLPSGTAPGQLGDIMLTYPGAVTQPAPTLTVTMNPNESGALEPNSLILTWSTNNVGFALQSTTNLGSSTVWTNVPAAPVVVNGLNTVTNMISGRQQFFRLVGAQQN